MSLLSKILYAIFFFWKSKPKFVDREAQVVYLSAMSPNVPLTLDEYQREAFTVAKYPEKGTGSLMTIVYCGLGLGEAGEVQGKIKKIIRDNDGKMTLEVRDAIIGEVGDLLWYISALSTELGVTLDEVGRRNLEKLFDRANRGVIGGSGDNR